MNIMAEPYVYALENEVRTDFSGYNQLTRFYNTCLKMPDKQFFHIDFSKINWFDGNMCALLWAMIYDLYQKNNQSFSTDLEIIQGKFDVLLRNGFLKSDTQVHDDRKSTVPLRLFDCQNKEGFCDYVNNTLLNHRGMPDHLDDALRERISEDLLELFCNIQYHANTKDFLFVGGQYYPGKGRLIFTMVDLGEGFLPRIARATKGLISNDLDAISWALKGNSTKLYLENCPGGLGLKNIYKYCTENQGVLQVVSGGGFWSSDMDNTIFEGGRTLSCPFRGTTINLIFQNFPTKF
jgi:hypothetical protein